MKRTGVLFSIIAALLIAFLPVQAFAAEQSINLTLDGEKLQLDVSPLLQDNRTLIPIRTLSEELGLEVDWNASTQTATIVDQDLSIQLKVGSNEVTINGEKEKIEVPAMINKERIFVPIRFVMETYGLEVKWDQTSKTVQLQSSILVENMDELFEKMMAVELNSFSSDMELEQIMTVNGEKMKMFAKGTQDVVVDPFGIYQNMKMSVLGQEMIVEAYMTEDGFYIYEPTEGQWMQLDKSTLGDLNEILEMGNMSNDPVSQLELMEEYLTDVAIYDKGSHYVMNYSIDSAGFDQLLQDLIGSLVPLEDEMMPGLRVDKMNFTIQYDKETLYPTTFSSHTELSMDMDTEKMHMVQKMTGSYNNINKLDQITIPQEVIDNAVKMQ